MGPTKEELEFYYYEKRLLQREIAELYGIKQSRVSYLMYKFGIKTRAPYKMIDRTGQRYGRLTVLSPVCIKKQNGFRWYCRCDCGNEVFVFSNSLKYGSTQSCGCLKREHVGSNHKGWKGHGVIPGGFISRYKNHSKRRKIEFSVSMDYLNNLFIKQEGLCAYTGHYLSFENYGYKNYYNAPSLDRINSAKGYVEGNVQWVLKDVNFMKQALSEERFIELCGVIHEHAKKKEASYS